MPNIKFPVLSICIPTYNRGKLLDNLLRQLFTFSDEIKSRIQICISDNSSSDCTPCVIDHWKKKLDIQSIRQNSNIGLSRNFQAVTALAAGKWIMVIGDDDELLDENFNELLILLTTTINYDWILVGVAVGSATEHLLGDLRTGRYSANSFRRIVIRTAMHRFGFIGMHVFPSNLQFEIAGLSNKQIRSWPHLAIFIRYLKAAHVQVFNLPVVKQAGGGEVLFWQVSDWIEISLHKLDIIADVKQATAQHHWFYNTLMLRELYSITNAKTVLMWKALKPLECSQNIFGMFIPRYRLLGSYAFLAVLHLIFVFCTYIIPSGAIRGAMILLGRGSVLTNYQRNEKAKGAFDGVKRGL